MRYGSRRSWCEKEPRMWNMDQKGTVIFGRSGRAQKLGLQDGSHTPILFIISVYFAAFQSDCLTTEIAFRICRLLAVAIPRLFEASHSCFGLPNCCYSVAYYIHSWGWFLISWKSWVLWSSHFEAQFLHKFLCNLKALDTRDLCCSTPAVW